MVLDSVLTEGHDMKGMPLFRSDASSPWGSPSESDEEPSFRVTPARRSLSNYAKDSLLPSASRGQSFFSYIYHVMWLSSLLLPNTVLIVLSCAGEPMSGY